MRKHTFVILIVVCTVLILTVAAIAYAWHAGVLDTFAYLYDSFGTKATSLFHTIRPFAPHAWLLIVLDLSLFTYILITKRKPWLWGLALLVGLQLLIMLVVMFGSKVS